MKVQIRCNDQLLQLAKFDPIKYAKNPREFMLFHRVCKIKLFRLLEYELCCICHTRQAKRDGKIQEPAKIFDDPMHPICLNECRSIFKHKTNVRNNFLKSVVTESDDL